MTYIALTNLFLGLIVLSWLDIKYLILPDCIVLPLLWLGLLLSLLNVFSTPKAAILGAVSGYLFLWVLARIFKLLRGYDGLGYGDLKLTAMFGAWFGWQALPYILLFASIIGIVIFMILFLLKRASYRKPMPFGPCIAMAGVLWILCGKVLLLHLC